MSNQRQQPQPPLPQWDNSTSVAAAISSQPPPPIYEYMYPSGARYLSRPTPPQPPAPHSLNGMGFDDLSPYDFPCASGSVSLLAPRQIKEEKLSRSPLMPLLGQDTPMSLDAPPNLRMCPQQIHYQNQHSQQQEQLHNEQQHYQEQQRALQEQQQQQLQEQQQEHQDEQQMQDSEPQQQFQEEQNSSEQQQLSEQNIQDDDHQSHSKIHNHHFQQQNISNTTTSTTTTISLPGLVIESDGLPMETPKKSAARRVWSHTETKYFLNTMHRYYHNIQSACTNNQKGELWDRVVEEHNRHYPERSKRSCQQQWERLFCRYKATKRHNNQPGVTPVLFEYNEEIKAIVGEINSFTDTYEEKAGIYLDRFSLERFTLNRTSSSSSAAANIVSMPPIGFESSFLSFDSSTSPIIESSLHGINGNNHHHNSHHPQNSTSNGSITLKRAAAEALMMIDEGTSSTSSIGINNSNGTGGIINQQQRKNKKSKTNIEKLFELLERQHQEDQERKREERQRWEEYQRKNEEFKQQLVDAFNGLVDVLREIHTDIKKETSLSLSVSSKMVDKDSSEWLKAQRGARTTRWDTSVNGGSTPNTSNTPTTTQTFYTWDNKVVDLKIVPNPQLKKSFYGINYGPVNATYPSCGNTLGDVIEDVKLLSQLTNRLRLYGMDCNAANYTIMAIKILGLKMTVVPTIWVDNNMTTYQRQYNDLFNNLKQHGFDYIEGISVGNEVIFRKEIPVSDFYSRIADVRKKVLAMPGAPKNMPVFTSDLGSNVDQAFVSAVDIAFANVHPYFGGVAVANAATWTFQFFEENDVAPAAKQNKTAVISEVGWPTNGAPDQGAIATVPNLNTFIQSFLCQANSKGYRYYYFESFDTPWKTQMFTVLEGSWGLFYPDRSLKPGVSIPNCQPTAPSLR
ncbi:1687_t:CDS:2 [Ambispora leptoticha]|uniref:glucan endo-1,3-beta-D-glucosidase n=1 Tax=Ambispora leptoticha TaxID=144679 RepID=A0A9N9GW06_9GLOM|nr:1687_t:CDS:2 [Ambispora leptoticha]